MFGAARYFTKTHALMNSEPSPTSEEFGPVFGVLMLLLAALYFHLARRAQETGDVTIPAMLGFGRDNFGQVTPAQAYAVSAIFALYGFGIIIRWFKLSRRNRDK